ncbi:KINESIN-LIKE PROTEIN KLP-3 [Salix koriyanagi]|uniref:KINESIN-LIKE PROTEIN KLP-3 n=1 Tax=Salix koriyanagi TaxID=2511006 RepID=A0A9Q0VYR8_9ROSI|nr:KINESIN-LIKE PROTEIN KLP-3 [Salix koriyanagi]
MSTEQQQQVWPFSVASVVEDMLQENIGTRPRGVDLVASRKAEETSLRRYEAAGWLRKTVGVVGGKDLPAEPSEEEFRLGLRSGIVLCNVLNKVQPGAVPKVVEGPGDSAEVPDGAALSAFQYFENVRNFLVSIEEMGIPTFEASDLEQGGKSARDCELGDPSSFDEQFNDLSEAGASRSLNVLVRAALSNKKQEEIPNIVESMLNKVMEEFERRLVSQNEQMKITAKDMEVAASPEMPLSRTSSDTRMEEETSTQINTEERCHQKGTPHEESEDQLLKQQALVERQEQDIKELKLALCSTKEGMLLLQMKHVEEFNNLGKHLHGLAHAASGYQRVLEENRKLYNQVQDLKGIIGYLDSDSMALLQSYTKFLR